jgi:hypothetical protein
VRRRFALNRDINRNLKMSTQIEIPSAGRFGGACGDLVAFARSSGYRVSRPSIWRGQSGGTMLAARMCKRIQAQTLCQY